MIHFTTETKGDIINHKQFLYNLPLVIFEISYDFDKHIGNFSYLNREGSNYFKQFLTEKDMQEGFEPRNLFVDHELQTHNLRILDSLSAEQPITLSNNEFLLRTLDNHQVITNATITMIVKDNTLIVQGFLNDNTKIVRNNTEFILMKKEIEDFYDLFHFFNGIIMIVNDEGRILFISPNANEKILYKPRKEVMGKTFAEIFPIGQTNFFMSKILEALTSSIILDYEYHLPIGNKVKWFKATLIPIEPSAGERKKALALIWEITHLKFKM